MADGKVVLYHYYDLYKCLYQFLYVHMLFTQKSSQLDNRLRAFL